jgi:hypothetical protein
VGEGRTTVYRRIVYVPCMSYVPYVSRSSEKGGQLLIGGLFTYGVEQSRSAPRWLLSLSINAAFRNGGREEGKYCVF